MDIPYNDKKIRNIQSISLRNLFYETNEHKQDFGRIKPRRSTIFQILDYSEDYSKLLKFNEKFLLTCFFSLHHKSGDLIYVSEISKLNANPNFNSFVLPNNKSNKLDHLVIKVWVKFNEWKLLIQWDCDLNGLSYIEDIDTLECPNNTVIIRLEDRYYYKKAGNAGIRRPKTSMSNHKLPSYTFDMIRSINNLDRSIKELNHSKIQISKQIDSIDRKDDIESVYNKMFQTQITIDDIERRISKQRLINDELLSEIMKLKIFNNKIDDIKNDNLQFVHNFKNEIELIRNQIPTIHQSIQETNQIIKEHFKQFSLVLNELLPITQSDMYSLSIENVELPSNIGKTLKILYQTNDEDILRINTGINYITQMVMMFLNLTKVPVYYHVLFKGNYSTIKDFRDKEYPLFYDPSLTKKKTEFKNGVNEVVLKNELFESGVNLLNKNLLLVCKQLNELYNQDLMDNIPIDCLDNFLWILQYLILFMTAEQTEL